MFPHLHLEELEHGSRSLILFLLSISTGLIAWSSSRMPELWPELAVAVCMLTTPFLNSQGIVVSVRGIRNDTNTLRAILSFCCHALQIGTYVWELVRTLFLIAAMMIAFYHA